MRKEAGEYEPLFRLESWRVHRREARRRQGRDRGDDQDLGQRRALSCARPRATARSTRWTARCATRSARSTRTCSDIELVNFKVRILDETKGTDAVTRVLLDASDGHDVVGLDRGAARTSSPPPGRRSWTRWSIAEQPAARRRACDPARQARHRRRARRSSCSRCCARGSSRSGRACRRSSEAFAARVGAPHACAVSSRDDRAAPGAARRRRGRGRRGRHLAVLVRGVGERALSTSARGRCSPTSTRSR